MRLKNKVAVVTGALRGIGRSIALALAREGAKVVIIDCVSDGTKDLSSSSTADVQIPMIIEADVSNLSEHDRVIQSTLETFGCLDILVNNAGINRHTAFLNTDVATWEKIIGTNLKGAYFLSQRAAHEMVKQRGGKIINVTSVHDTIPSERSSVYAISKAAMKMMTKALALELAEYQINVNAISPGTILHERHKRQLADSTYQAELSSRIPLHRAGQPDDVAGAAVFLSSADSDYMTGQTIYVDGGLLLR